MTGRPQRLAVPGAHRAGRVRLAAAVLLLTTAAAGCGQAGDRVTTGPDGDAAPQDSISAVLTSGGGPAPTTASPTAAAASSTAVATTVTGPTTTKPAGTATSTSAAAPSSTAAPSATAVRVLGIDCARHSEDGGEWLVFHLSGLDATATAAYGPAPVQVAGDNTLLVTITPAVDASAGRYSFVSSCDWVVEVAAAPRSGDGLTFAVGTKGRPRVLAAPFVGPSARGAALVVKLGA